MSTPLLPIDPPLTVTAYLERLPPTPVCAEGPALRSGRAEAEGRRGNPGTRSAADAEAAEASGAGADGMAASVLEIR